MAKIIRFPLQMKEGTAVRTLDELREHFDLESVLGYYADGKLKTWLADRYYDEMAEKVAELSADTPDLNAKICEILGVDYSRQKDDTDFEALQRRNEKLRVLREITADQNILDNVDAVAFDQDELFDILDEAPEVIYLYGEKFSIPIAKGNITYIGINSPVVSLEKSGYEYKQNGITFQKIHIDYPDTTVSAQIQKAEQLILQGKYQEAFSIIRESAENGDARAMYHMALFYNNGYDVVEIDNNSSDEWIKNAFSFDEPLSLVGYAQKFLSKDSSEQKSVLADCFERLKQMSSSGDMIAQCLLGNMYRDGFGTIKDFESAVNLYRKAAEQGYARAQYSLGYMYNRGEGVEQNYELAVEWYRKAAEQGHARAQYRLGWRYESGRGVSQDYRLAVEWYRKSAEQGYATAQNSLGDMYYSGKGVSQDYRLAVEWYRKAAEQGNDMAQYNLGFMYQNGKGVPQDDALAAEWYRKAAEQGNAYGQYNLGKMYGNGEGVEQNDTLAAEWYRKAAEQGYARAQNSLGEMYEYGSGVEQNDTLAAEWYQKAANQGYAAAQEALGNMYIKGQGVEQNTEMAAEWYRKAADQGVGSAQYRLGSIYWESGNLDDRTAALYWFEEAAKQKDYGVYLFLCVHKKNTDLKNILKRYF